jgi:hypothetical protein
MQSIDEWWKQRELTGMETEDFTEKLCTDEREIKCYQQAVRDGTLGRQCHSSQVLEE